MTPSACHLEVWEAAWLPCFCALSKGELRVGELSAYPVDISLLRALRPAVGPANWAQVLNLPENWPQGAAGSGIKENPQLGHSEPLSASL